MFLETHLLRLIEKHISFAFVREKLKASYSDTGRPSIDPELSAAHPVDRLLVYGFTSEAEAGGGTPHASGMALVHRSGFRPGDSAPLHVLQATGTEDFRNRSYSSSYSNES